MQSVDSYCLSPLAAAIHFFPGITRKLVHSQNWCNVRPVFLSITSNSLALSMSPGQDRHSFFCLLAPARSVFSCGAHLIGTAPSSPFGSPRGQGHPCPTATQQVQTGAENAREGLLDTDGLQWGVPPSRELWGRAVVCGWPHSLPENMGEGQGARGVPLSH